MDTTPTSEVVDLVDLGDITSQVTDANTALVESVVKTIVVEASRAPKSQPWSTAVTLAAHKVTTDVTSSLVLTGRTDLVERAEAMIREAGIALIAQGRAA